MKRFALPAALAIIAATAQAAPVSIGQRACSEFTSASDKIAAGKFRIRDVSGVDYASANAPFVAWAHGYLSGLRSADAAPLSKRMSAEAFDRQLRDYCAAHPAEPFANAVGDLAKREGIARK
ncbi:MAG: hypothetical protein U1E28_03320 [Beijerinckiaceae bacterium]